VHAYVLHCNKHFPVENLFVEESYSKFFSLTCNVLNLYLTKISLRQQQPEDITSTLKH